MISSPAPSASGVLLFIGISWGSAALAAALEEPEPGRIQDLYLHSQKVAEETRLKVPRSAKPIFDLARVHQRFGFDDRAVQLFREGLVADPNHPEVLKEIGFLLSQRNIMNEASAAYRDALKLDPMVPEAHTRLGLILIHQGRQREAVEEFRAEIQNRTAGPNTYTLLGHALKDLRNFPEAVRSYQEAVRLDPHDRGAYYGLAQAEKLLGRSEEEAKAMARFVQLKTGEDQATQKAAQKGDNRTVFLRFTAQTYLDAGQTYLMARMEEEAERAFRTALRFNPAQTSAAKHLVDLQRRTGRTAEALAGCRELVAAERSPQNLFLLAGLLTEHGDFAEAGSLLEEVTRVEKRDADAPRELARLILGQKAPGDSQRALELARRAVENGPAAVNYDVLSWALYQKGDLDGALEALATAARLDPGTPAYQKRLETLRKAKGAKR